MELDVSEGNKKEPTASPYLCDAPYCDRVRGPFEKGKRELFLQLEREKIHLSASVFRERKEKKQLMQFCSYPVGSTLTYSPCGWRSRWAPAINLGGTSCEEDIYYMAKRREKRRGRDGDACSSSSCTQSNRLSGGDWRGGRVRVTSCNRSR